MDKTRSPNRAIPSLRMEALDSKHSISRENISSIKRQIESLATRLVDDLTFYKTYGLSRCTCDTFSIDPVLSPAKTHASKLRTPDGHKSRPILPLWETIVKKLRSHRMKQQKAAYLIQTIWRMSEGKTETPKIDRYLALDLSDWQAAEERALKGLQDGQLGQEYEKAMLDSEEEEEEESED